MRVWPLMELFYKVAFVLGAFGVLYGSVALLAGIQQGVIVAMLGLFLITISVAQHYDTV